MPLETTLTDITARLRQGRFPNEQAISQGIVLRVLQELGWDTWDTNIIWPEYQTGEGRADFALCHPASKPAIFIEVKQPGKAEDAVRQALEYAFHTGVPFVVLTDGRTWSFYLPAEQGSYEDRRVYKLDLFERPPAEAAATLDRYLARARVESGEALDTARKEYRSRNRKSQARAAIPDAWRELVEKGDELLVLRELAKNDPSFLERCSQHPDAQGRKRRYIARTPEELYPDREDLCEMRESLPGGWLVATNLNNVLKKTIIRLAAEVAGLEYGKDVVVEF